MEASIIFHFAGRGLGNQRLSLLDFAQLLDPRWKSPHAELEMHTPTSTTTSFLNSLLQSSYSFAQGGLSFPVKVLSNLSSCFQVWPAHSVRLLFIPSTWVSRIKPCCFVLSKVDYFLSQDPVGCSRLDATSMLKWCTSTACKTSAQPLSANFCTRIALTVLAKFFAMKVS
jgi:hypothetical protein